MRPTKHSINAKQKRAAIQPSPHKEPLGVYAHAHGIKLLYRKYFLEVFLLRKRKVSDTKKVWSFTSKQIPYASLLNNSLINE